MAKDPYPVESLTEALREARGEPIEYVPPMLPKPPLGLKPKRIHDAERVMEIDEAITRYLIAGADVPDEWMRERHDLLTSLRNTRTL